MCSEPTVTPDSCAYPLDAMLTGPICICPLTTTALQTHAPALWQGSLPLADQLSHTRWGREALSFICMLLGAFPLFPCFCPPGVLGFVNMPCDCLAISVWSFPMAWEATQRAKAFPQRTSSSLLSSQSHTWSHTLGHCHWGRERRFPYLLPLPSRGSSTFTFRCMAAWVSQMSVVLCECPLLVSECPFCCILVERV